jgi:hypothetical protein
MRPNGAACAGKDFMGTFGITRMAAIAGGLAFALAAAAPAAAGPVAAPSANAYLYAVWNTVNGASCPANGDCIVVGGIGTDTATLTLAEVWTGGHWKVLPTLNVPHDVGTLLDGVACVSRTSCVAVGYSQSSPDNTGYSVLAERFNGAHWSMIAPKQP